MDSQPPLQSRRVTRDELYTLVWNASMSRLGTEFGISGNGLAKICDRLQVPYPPRGYWAKKEAGKPVVIFKLPIVSDGIAGWVDIHPTPRKPAPFPEVQVSIEAATAAVGNITVPETLDDLHPRSSTH
jgi:hypothetical protein